MARKDVIHDHALRSERRARLYGEVVSDVSVQVGLLRARLLDVQWHRSKAVDVDLTPVTSKRAARGIDLHLHHVSRWEHAVARRHVIELPICVRDGRGRTGVDLPGEARLVREVEVVEDPGPFRDVADLDEEVGLLAVRVARIFQRGTERPAHVNEVVLGVNVRVARRVLLLYGVGGVVEGERGLIHDGGRTVERWIERRAHAEARELHALRGACSREGVDWSLDRRADRVDCRSRATEPARDAGEARRTVAASGIGVRNARVRHHLVVNLKHAGASGEARRRRHADDVLAHGHRDGDRRGRGLEAEVRHLRGWKRRDAAVLEARHRPTREGSATAFEVAVADHRGLLRPEDLLLGCAGRARHHDQKGKDDGELRGTDASAIHWSSDHVQC